MLGNMSSLAWSISRGSQSAARIFLRDDLGVFRQIHVFKQVPQIHATDAGQRYRMRARNASGDARRFLQQQIAGGVAKGVVDLFKIRSDPDTTATPAPCSRLARAKLFSGGLAAMPDWPGQ